MKKLLSFVIAVALSFLATVSLPAIATTTTAVASQSAIASPSPSPSVSSSPQQQADRLVGATAKSDDSRRADGSCRCAGCADRCWLGSGFGKASRFIVKESDPDMEGREGVPRRSVGSGGRFRKGETFVPPRGDSPRDTRGGATRAKDVEPVIAMWLVSSRLDLTYYMTFDSRTEAADEALRLNKEGQAVVCQYIPDESFLGCPNP